MFDPFEQLDLNSDACAPPHLNQRIDGKYLIQKLIGSGSSSRVYSAKVYPGDALVAVKILRENCSTRIGERKLALEGSVLIEVSKHKNFVSVYDFGKSEAGEPYLVTELIKAISLKELLKDYKHLPVDKALEIGFELLDALEQLHAHGIFHTSFKPSDILLIDYFNKQLPEVKLVDLDSIFHPEEPELYNSELPSEGASYAYLSPEQGMESGVDIRSDIYVFAIVLYEMVCGRLPFKGSTAVEMLNNKMASNIVPFSESEFSSSISGQANLEALLRKCLQADKNRRVQSLAELKEELMAARKRTATTMEHEVDIKNWEKLPRSAYADKEKEKEADNWVSKVKKFMGG